MTKLYVFISSIHSFYNVNTML